MTASSQTAEADAEFNPFPGLRPFEADDDYLFFGREQQTDELLRKLRTTRFLSVLGTSGVGKSSLVRSGLIPKLHGGGMPRAGSRWRIAILRPGADPTGNLATALSAPGVLGRKKDHGAWTRAFIEATLRASRLGLVECIRQARLPERDNVLILVDQFEEIFRYKTALREAGRYEAAAFVKLLVAAHESDVPCYVALTMRADFLGECIEFGEMPAVFNEGVYLVPRMTRDELQSAITGPVAVGEGRIAPRLVSQLLNDTGEELDERDRLPILQHALMRTWDRWLRAGRPAGGLDLEHYLDVGGMNALSLHADEAYDDLDPDQQVIAEKMFKALTDKGTDPRGVRRPAPMSEICALTGATLAEVEAVVEVFRRPGRSFLMPPPQVALQADSILDISHESLMRIWRRLADWAGEEAQSAQSYLGVARAAASHADGKRAYLRDPELQFALTWHEQQKPTEAWAARYDPTFAQAMAFLDASKTARDEENRQREASRRRELRQARLLVLILAIATLVTFALLAYANNRSQVAKQEQEKAEAIAVSFEKANQRLLEAKAATDLANFQVRKAALEALNAKGETEIQRLVAVLQATKAQEQANKATKQEGIARQSLVNETAALIEARGARDDAREATRLAKEATLKVQEESGEKDRLNLLATSRTLALKIPENGGGGVGARQALEAYRLHRENRGDAADWPDLFSAMRRALESLRPVPTAVIRSGVRAVATARGGTVWVAASDGNVLQVALDGKTQPVVFVHVSSAARSLAVSTDGNLTAVGSIDGRIRTFDSRGAASAMPDLIGGAGSVTSLAFKPGTSVLAAANSDGTVRVWDLGRKDEPVTLRNTTGRKATSVAFSPNGAILLAGFAGALPSVPQTPVGALRWMTNDLSATPVAACHDLEVSSVAFGADNHFACGGTKGTVVVGVLNGEKLKLEGHKSSVTSLSFDSKSDFLASASLDNTIRLWNLKNPTTGNPPTLWPVTLPGHTSWVLSVAFTPDGQHVISGSADRTVRIWPARTDVLARYLCAEVGGRTWTKEEWETFMPAGIPFVEKPSCTEGN